MRLWETRDGSAPPRSATRKVGAFILLLAWVALLVPAHGGHEVPIYPSYYPQEIRIETVDRASAARLLADGSIHAYVGEAPSFGGAPPKSVGSVASLGSYLVATVRAASAYGETREARCAAIAHAIQKMAKAAPGFVAHPYPITPFDADYLNHYDLAEAAKRRYAEVFTPLPGYLAEPRIRVKGEEAEAVDPSPFPQDGPDWDVSVEAVDTRALVLSHSYTIDGWIAPPWLKEGWYHAFLLLGGGLADDAGRQSVAIALRRLESGGDGGAVDKINLERKLVSLLTADCRKAVIGYTVRREYVNVDFSAGIENIAFDSQTGLDSPAFIRTVKLKDFPWNGWLRIGIEGRPTAAWNPIGGFTDEAGGLIWSALGDPALLPAPYGAGWNPNRMSDVRSSSPP